MVVQPVQFTPFLRIEVKDDGPGIPDSEKELIFQESVHRQLTREGLGLGLTLVKKIVEHYGGYIRVEDRIPGKSKEGASFVLMLHRGENTGLAKAKSQEVA